MWNTLYLPGTTISSWNGVAVYEYAGGGRFRRMTHWSWSTSYHEHYEVARLATGSWWVPVSTNPPGFWERPTLVVGVPSTSPEPRVNPNGSEYRPGGVYFWVPAVPPPYVPGITTNRVDCHPPSVPPNELGTDVGAAPAGGLAVAQERLAAILAEPVEAVAAAPANAFQDSDGLISFVNLSSDLVNHSAEYKTGTEVFDKIANFFSTLRVKVFTAMQNGKITPLKGDPKPATQWDLTVTHYMQYLLQETGGLTDYAITEETYSETQVVAEFSADFVKLLFDAVTVPSSVIGGVTAFISGVGTTLRTSWDDRVRTYSVDLLGQCHEAVQQNSDGAPDYRYFPKLKYYHLTVDSQQSEFTSDCATVRKITFNFRYEAYVTAVAAAVLDKTTAEYKSFTAFLDKAQAANYKDAQNQLDTVLDGGVSADVPKLNAFGVDLSHYPPARAEQVGQVERRRLVAV
ncbi:hypothetical protein [Umezawaea tangerina]|uniref:Virulence factor Evf domain-containing protein n=1 Tax=Umezawaea tangerina TaxID=84725 RepID=A0A2T0S5G0_9PSEU|nr:hypothetical protein [Umezawaea tangerina]PRY28646.1 hypothetical protein CLV43_1272 [Umezawaea tangerina]